MQRSLAVLQSTATARNRGVPVAPVLTPQWGREAFLEKTRQRNAALDWLFYDVKTITHDEAKQLSPWLAAEGAMLLVPPTGKGALTLFSSVDELAASRAVRTARTLVVAGVGSSALGAAALARNVADAVNAPVIAVVSGYGLADLAAEAIGGFFWFGALNAARHSLEWMDRLRESGVVADPSPRASGNTDNSPMQRSKDTRTVQALLTHKALSFDLLVGHSKGNLVLSEALFAIGAHDAQRLKVLGQQILIVTLSAKIAMPRAFRRVIDVMGQIDGFGALNSRPDIGTDYEVDRAWHHTNTELAGHLPVTETLRRVLYGYAREP